MTKKHFEAIAAAIRNTEMEARIRNVLTYRLSKCFLADNPRFDSIRFRQACQPESPPKKSSRFDG